MNYSKSIEYDCTGKQYIHNSLKDESRKKP